MDDGVELRSQKTEAGHGMAVIEEDSIPADQHIIKLRSALLHLSPLHPQIREWPVPQHLHDRLVHLLLQITDPCQNPNAQERGHGWLG